MAIHVSFTVPSNSQQAPLTNRNLIIGITFRDDDGDLIDVTGLTFIDLTIGSPNVQAETLTRQSIGFWHLGILLPENQALTVFEVNMGTNAVSYESQTNEEIAGTGFIWFDTSGSTTPTPSPTPSQPTQSVVAAATFGTPDYRENGVIAVPLTFAENVIAPSKTIIKFSKVSGSELTGIQYRLVGTNKDYKVIISVPPGRRGKMRLLIAGYVLKASGAWDSVTATPLDVSYGTIAPDILDFDVPEGYIRGKPFVVRVAFITMVTGWHLNNTITDIWIQEGAHLGEPTPYKWTDTAPPDIHGAVPLISVETQRSLANAIAVDVAGELELNSFNGVGTLEIQNSVAGVGVYEVRGIDENGDAQTETLTFEAADQMMTTANNFRSAGLEIEIMTAFAEATTADIRVQTMDYAESHWQKLESPPGGDPTPGMNDFDDDGNWHGEEGQYFLIFFTEVDKNAVGAFNWTLRPNNPLRGPIR